MSHERQALLGVGSCIPVRWLGDLGQAPLITLPLPFAHLGERALEEELPRKGVNLARMMNSLCHSQTREVTATFPICNLLSSLKFSL